MTFFSPIGSTYGIGQLGPMRALMLTDIVNRATNGAFPILTVDNLNDVYRSILDPETTIHYIAANVSLGNYYYRSIARFDLADNPGITATLYNLGREDVKAMELYNSNVSRLRNGQSIELPRENYYGWLINAKRTELQALLDRYR